MQIQLSLGKGYELHYSLYYRGFVNLEVDYSSQLTVLIVSWNAVLIIFGNRDIAEPV